MTGDFSDLQEKGFNQHNAYSLSKLAMIMITAEQAERLSQKPTVNCLDPGTVNTKMLIAGGLAAPIESFMLSSVLKSVVAQLCCAALQSWIGILPVGVA